MKKLLLALVASLVVSFAALAGEWFVVIDGVRYEQQKVTLKMGEELKIDEYCTYAPQGLHKTKTCVWRKAIRSTEGGVMVSGHGSSSATSLRVELFAATASIGMMLLVMAVIVKSMPVATYFATLAFASAVLAPFLFFTTHTILLASMAAICAAYALLLTALIAANDVQNKKRKFYSVAWVHIGLTLAAIWLAM